jgi:hypothetical protein
MGSEFIKEVLCTHPISLNVRHFGMAEATRLRKYGLEVNFNGILPTKFHVNPLIDSKVVSGDTHADRLVI